MAIDWQSILKKLHGIRDLREALVHVKKATAEESSLKKGALPQPPQSPAPRVIHVNEPAKPAPAVAASNEQKAPAPAAHQPLEMLGRNKTQSGHVNFIVGNKGADKHYEMSVDLNAQRKGLPAITVSHRTSAGGLLSRHGVIHADKDSAIRAIHNHHIGGAWE